MSILDLSYARQRIEVGNQFTVGEIQPPANLIEVSPRLREVILSHTPEGLPGVAPTDESEEWALGLLREAFADVTGEGTIGVSLRSVDLFDSPKGERLQFQAQNPEHAWLWLLDSPALRWAFEQLHPTLPEGVADQLILYRNLPYEEGTRFRCRFTLAGIESVTHVDPAPLGVPQGKVWKLLLTWWKKFSKPLFLGMNPEDLQGHKWDALFALHPWEEARSLPQLLDILPVRQLPNQAKPGCFRWRDHARTWEASLAS